jgi:cellulose synthase (UDP-forming)
MTCRIADFSAGGVSVQLPVDANVENGTQAHVSIYRGDKEGVFPVRIVATKGSLLGVQFEDMPLDMESDLVQLTYARADVWLNHWAATGRESAVKSLYSIAKFSLHGIRVLLRESAGMLVRRVSSSKSDARSDSRSTSLVQNQ